MKNIKRIILGLSLLVFVIACEKPEVGYLSDDIFYNVNPYRLEMGVTSFSSPIVANGSTSPLSVKLLGVYDEDGNNVTEEFTTPQNIVTFKGTITYNDSTLGMLQEKLQDSLVSPFAVNKLGGRLEFSAATSYLATGNFSVDVNVGNIKGEYDIKDACDIIIGEVEEPAFLAYKRIGVTDTKGTTDTEDDEVILGGSTSDGDISVTIEHIPGGMMSQCVYKFTDVDGKPFNPANGEVKQRGSNLPFMSNWNPWYQLQYTDTAIVQEMPHYAGLNFPYMSTIKLDNGSEWTDVNAGSYVVIPGEYVEGLNENADINYLISFQFYATGTYIITTQAKGFKRIAG